MHNADPIWEQRVADLWQALDDHAAELLSAELHAASGREREAVAISLTALSHYLPRYNRSLARYAEELAATASER